jgi:hypothetical protein
MRLAYHKNKVYLASLNRTMALYVLIIIVGTPTWVVRVDNSNIWPYILMYVFMLASNYEARPWTIVLSYVFARLM